VSREPTAWLVLETGFLSNLVSCICNFEPKIRMRINKEKGIRIVEAPQNNTCAVMCTIRYTMALGHGWNEKTSPLSGEFVVAVDMSNWKRSLIAARDKDSPHTRCMFWWEQTGVCKSVLEVGMWDSTMDEWGSDNPQRIELPNINMEGDALDPSNLFRIWQEFCFDSVALRRQVKKFAPYKADTMTLILEGALVPANVKQEEVTVVKEEEETANGKKRKIDAALRSGPPAGVGEWPQQPDKQLFWPKTLKWENREGAKHEVSYEVIRPSVKVEAAEEEEKEKEKKQSQDWHKTAQVLEGGEIKGAAELDEASPSELANIVVTARQAVMTRPPGKEPPVDEYVDDATRKNLRGIQQEFTISTQLMLILTACAVLSPEARLGILNNGFVQGVYPFPNQGGNITGLVAPKIRSLD
jgi:hypothetical protein